MDRDHRGIPLNIQIEGAADRRRAEKIRQTLMAAYPHVKTQLSHRNAYELLMATILSAQCTDRQVNRVTPALFTRLPTPEKMARARLSTIEGLIRSTGFYRNKARHLKACAADIVRRFEGRVPSAMADLVSLPGVGRKTANVVRGAAFGKPGMVVDTHVARISRRLGLTVHRQPEKIEQDLMEVIPEKDWSDFSLRLVYFGRDTCRARRPLCPECPLRSLCPWPQKSTPA